jgi:cell division protein FtsQ
MDGAGRLDQPLTRSRYSAGDAVGAAPAVRRRARGRPRRRARVRLPAWQQFWRQFRRQVWPSEWVSAWRWRVVRWTTRLSRLPSGAGVAASILLLLAAIGYGVVKGDHLPVVIDWTKTLRDEAASSLGFRIATISLSGEKEMSREDILDAIGVTNRTSLLFLDADAARARLLAIPRIGDAAVLKLYPDRLQITITERQAFALWQKDGKLSVVAEDGTVLEPFSGRYAGLPLVVGKGAARRAKDFLAVVDQYSGISGAVRASILVAQRRWNLRLNNGIDVELPESDVAAALQRLVALDHDKKLLSRDVTSIDLRIPDRVTVRLSPAALQARDDEQKDSAKKKKGGNA